METMRRSKGVVLLGPGCSGKTHLLQLVTLSLKNIFEVQLRTSYVSPAAFSGADLYGPALAYDQNSVYAHA